MSISAHTLSHALHALQNAVHATFPEGLPATLRAADALATAALGGPEPGAARDAEALFAPMPWRVGGTRDGLGPNGMNDRFIRDAAGRTIASTCASWGSLEEARATAQRIVVCVNACAGSETAALETFSLRAFRESAMDVVRNWERGDLAGAVNNLHGATEDLGAELADEPEGVPA